ncbi:hypothetical protein KKF32_00650 [Patescibacteria group bacterium]|nr:hypothetical protein [Patescibacteria group bacterium]
MENPIIAIKVLFIIYLLLSQVTARLYIITKRRSCTSDVKHTRLLSQIKEHSLALFYWPFYLYSVVRRNNTGECPIIGLLTWIAGAVIFIICMTVIWKSGTNVFVLFLFYVIGVIPYAIVDAFIDIIIYVFIMCKKS